MKEKIASFRIPYLGLRTIKTVIGVALSALFVRYVMGQTPFFACIGAVVAMERTLSSSVRAGIVRNVGTMVGGLMGIAICSFTQNILLVSLGLIPLIAINSLLGKRESIVPGAIVYFAVAYLNTSDTAWIYGLNRILGTLVGTLIALAVNALVFPPRPAEETQSDDDLDGDTPPLSELEG